MKNNLFLHLFRHLLVLCLILNSQFSIINCFAQCYPPARTTELATNNIRAFFKTNGLHFSEAGRPGFEVPKGSGKTTIYGAGLWIAGLDEQDQLHFAAVGKWQIGNDFYTGPVSDGGNAAGAWYDRFWRVTKEEIEYHKLHYNESTYHIPSSIAEWPAHGKTELNESYHLAPYVDVSENGKYSPELGDYPKIKGDEAIFFIQNDICNIHTGTGGLPLGVEILCMAYAFNSQSEALKNTIFLSHTIRNKSTTHYKDFYASFFVDFELGYGEDDYVGCDSTLNLSYVYDSNQEENPPVQGAMFLNQKMSSFMYFGDWNTPIGVFPKIPNEYYNNMQAKWIDGTHLTYGGNGYDTVSTNYTHFAFSGDPGKLEGWTELTPNGTGSSPNAPGDRSGVMSAGPFLLPAGGTINLDIAFPWAKSLSLLKDQINNIQDYYDQHLDIAEHITTTGKILLYPNPTNGELRIENGELTISSVEVFDIYGRQLSTFYFQLSTNKIDISNLQTGIYLIRITTEAGIVTQKVIKN